MNLGTMAAVGLKCALRHGTALLNSILSIWLSGRHSENFHFQTKIEYISSAPKPQKICLGTIFSQSLVQLFSKKKNAEETTLELSSVCASIGNVQYRIF
jgi:hypothetical protein